VALAQTTPAENREAIKLGWEYYDENDELNSCIEISGSTEAYIIGDSYSVGMEQNNIKEKLKANGYTDVTVNGVVGRSVNSGGGNGEPAIKAVDTDTSKIAAAGVIVIVLGTNPESDNYATGIPDLMKKLNEKNRLAKKFWVNVGHSASNVQSRIAPTNANIAKYSTQYNYSVIDWNDVYNKNPSYDGGLHPSPEGYKALVDLVVKSVGKPSITSTGDQGLAGRNNAEKIFNYLVGKGLTAVQAAGIMGNLRQESSYNPSVDQNGDEPGGGYGIAQWTAGRRDALEAAAKKQGVPVDNLAFQLEYLYKESNRRTMRDFPDRIEWEGLKEVAKLSDAVIYWEYNFERAGTPMLGARLQYAKEALAKYANGNPSTSLSGNTVGCSSNLSDVGDFSLPVDRRFYTQHKEWFTKPHHDYPSADIPVPTGTRVYSIGTGKITRAPITSNDTSYGNGVWIDAGNGIEIIYGHGVDGGTVTGAKVGDEVKPGQLIMHSGSTGNSTGPHLHLEIRVGGNEVCPQSLFIAIAENKTIPDIKQLPRQGCTY
jgi:murein DD-endopeptidase MepM/ murein hydrolase activator NlpD/lysophospholipase L1-like esterase